LVFSIDVYYMSMDYSNTHISKQYCIAKMPYKATSRNVIGNTEARNDIGSKYAVIALDNIHTE